MKNRPGRIQPFLVIMISFLLVIWPAYLQYNDLIEIDFLSPNLTFENLDPDNLLSDKQDKAISLLTFSLAISFLGFFRTKHLSSPAFRIFAADQRISILRC